MAEDSWHTCPACESQWFPFCRCSRVLALLPFVVIAAVAWADIAGAI